MVAGLPVGGGVYMAELGAHIRPSCPPSSRQLPSSRWKAIRAALERAVKRAKAAAATADGEAAANAVAPPPLAGAQSSCSAGSGAQAAASDPSELPPLGLLDKDEALSLEALRLLFAARDAADATAPLPPSEPREGSRPACPICACVSSCVLFDRTTEAGVHHVIHY